MKTKKQNRVVTTMKAASAILGHPLFIIAEAKDAGSPAFKSSGRVDVDQLRNWIANEWCPMPRHVFAHLHKEWQTKVRPTLTGPFGVVDSVEEASKRTGLSLAMIEYIRQAMMREKG